jgi:hypothetical protein
MWFPRFFLRQRASHPAHPAGRASHPSRPRPEEEELADEVDSFVTGRLLDHFVRRGGPVPPWVVLNRLAHATVGELERIAEGDGRHSAVGVPAWARVERSLAIQVLACGPSLDRVREAQLALVALELRLIDQAKVDSLSAEDVMHAASWTLDEHRLGL